MLIVIFGKYMRVPKADLYSEQDPTPLRPPLNLFAHGRWLNGLSFLHVQIRAAAGSSWLAETTSMGGAKLLLKTVVKKTFQ